MTPQEKESGDKVFLHWSGDLTIRRISALKGEVQAALEEAPHVVITLAADAEGDVTLMQLLCAAHRTAVGQDKTLELCGAIPSQFQMIMALAGFSRHIGCSRDTPGSCLWEQIPRSPGAAALS